MFHWVFFPHHPDKPYGMKTIQQFLFNSALQAHEHFERFCPNNNDNKGIPSVI